MHAGCLCCRLRSKRSTEFCGCTFMEAGVNCVRDQCSATSARDVGVCSARRGSDQRYAKIGEMYPSVLQVVGSSIPKHDPCYRGLGAAYWSVQGREVNPYSPTHVFWSDTSAAVAKKMHAWAHQKTQGPAVAWPSQVSFMLLHPSVEAQ